MIKQKDNNFLFFVFCFSITKSFEEVREAIRLQFAYQSSLELAQNTYEQVSKVHSVTELRKHPRQKLIKRLDGYANNHPQLFSRAVDFINDRFIPLIECRAFSGEVMLNLTNEDLQVVSLDRTGSSAIIHMIHDIMAERGYQVIIDARTIVTPVRFDLQTGEIESQKKTEFRFCIRFKSVDSLREGR